MISIDSNSIVAPLWDKSIFLSIIFLGRFEQAANLRWKKLKTRKWLTSKPVESPNCGPRVTILCGPRLLSGI